MRNTKSARAVLVLGATLIVATWAGQAVAGISGGDTAGISGGDVLGISGGDTAGISGGDIIGISGGDTAGISGGDILGISGGDTAGISGGDILGISGGDSAVLAGPVESIDHANGVFGSMGQVVMASQDMLSNLRLGDFVTVQGSVVSSGWYYADALSVSENAYVAGSTEVFLVGLLSSINQSNGTAQMGDLTIDYTMSLGRDLAPSGEMWAFRGIRPSFDGLLISDRTESVR